jgi:hypothetical protein
VERFFVSVGALYLEESDHLEVTDVDGRINHSCRALDMYSGGAQLQSRSGHLLSLLRFFVIFPRPSKEMSE